MTVESYNDYCPSQISMWLCNHDAISWIKVNLHLQMQIRKAKDHFSPGQDPYCSE